MTTKNTRIGYILPSLPIEQAVASELLFKQHFPTVDFIRIDSIDMLIKLVVNSPFTLDFIHIDIGYFYNTADNLTDMVRTLQTLFKLHKCQTKIFANVGEDDDEKTIRQVIPFVDGLSIRQGNTWTLDNVMACITDTLNGKFNMPKLIREKLKNKPEKRTILVVSPNGIGDGKETQKMQMEIAKSLNAQYVDMPYLNLVYAFLSNEYFRIDAIGFDLNHLNEICGGDDVFTKIQTMIELIDSLQFIEDGFYRQRKTTIIGGASLDTDPAVIKDFLSIKGVTGIFPRGSEFTRKEKETAMKAYLAGESHVPKRIKEMLKPKSKKKASIDLTHREGQIYNIIVNQGCSNKVIARQLGLSEPTVKMHIGNILRKYNVRTRTQLAAFNK